MCARKDTLARLADGAKDRAAAKAADLAPEQEQRMLKLRSMSSI